MVFGDSPQFTLRGEAVAVGEDDMWIVLNLWQLNAVQTDFAPANLDTATATRTVNRIFDDTVGTPKYINHAVVLPNNIDSAGTVTAYISFYAATAAASKNIAARIGHHVIANDETRTKAYTAWNTGDIAIINTQDDLQIFSMQETVANLAWAPSAVSRLLRLRFSRQAASINELVGNLLWEAVTIHIPTTGSPS